MLVRRHGIPGFRSRIDPVEQLPLPGRGAMQEIASKKVGEVQVSYSTSATSASSAYTGLNDLKETTYGLQLLSLLRLYGFAKYIL